MTGNIEQGFFKMLQSDIVMSIDGKVYKTGKFINFKIKEFYIQMDLVINDRYRKIDIPLPFETGDIQDGIIFSYKLDDMGTYGAGINKMFKNTIGGGKSKLYDKDLVIRRGYIKME
jgi:hypothetical protein